MFQTATLQHVDRFSLHTQHLRRINETSAFWNTGGAATRTGKVRVGDISLPETGRKAFFPQERNTEGHVVRVILLRYDSF